MRNGTVYPQQPLVPLTGEIESFLWPTPIASRAGVSQQTLQMGRERRLWPTMTASDANRSATDMLRKASLGAVVCRAQQNGGELNPEFVEYLMNFPKGWTDLTE